MEIPGEVLREARQTFGSGRELSRLSLCSSQEIVVLGKLVAKMVERELQGTGSRFGPVRNADVYPAPRDPAELVERRFGLLFDLYRQGPWDLPGGGQ